MKPTDFAIPRAAGSGDTLPGLDAGRDVRDDANTSGTEHLP